MGLVLRGGDLGGGGVAKGKDVNGNPRPKKIKEGYNALWRRVWADEWVLQE